MSQRMQLDILDLQRRMESLEKTVVLYMKNPPVMVDPTPRYEVRHRNARWFDVVDIETGVKANGRHLTRDDADVVCKDLNDGNTIPTMGAHAPKIPSVEGADAPP